VYATYVTEMFSSDPTHRWTKAAREARHLCYGVDASSLYPSNIKGFMEEEWPWRWKVIVQRALDNGKHYAECSVSQENRRGVRILPSVDSEYIDALNSLGFYVKLEYKVNNLNLYYHLWWIRPEQVYHPLAKMDPTLWGPGVTQLKIKMRVENEDMQLTGMEAKDRSHMKHKSVPLRRSDVDTVLEATGILPEILIQKVKQATEEGKEEAAIQFDSRNDAMNATRILMKLGFWVEIPWHFRSKSLSRRHIWWSR
jgi:hypothetical protein